MFIDYYQILGLQKSATSEEIKAVYHELAKKYHPDWHQGNSMYEEKFKSISDAYSTLSDPDKRKSYDHKYEYYEFNQTVETIWHETTATAPPTGKRRPRPYYTTKQREFTPFAWMFGKIFIMSLLLLILLIPLYLIRWASEVRFEEGLEFEKEGNYSDAVSRYKRAYSRFGSKNLESCLKIGRLSNEKLYKFSDAKYYYTLAFDYTNNDSIEAILHFQIAKSKSGMGDFDGALSSLDSASMMDFNQDSIIDVRSQVFTFGLEDYQLGKENYQYLVNRNIKLFSSYMGLGLCNYQLNLYDEAIQNYNSAELIDSTFSQLYVQRGLAYYFKYDSVSYCQDFEKAMILGSRLGRDQYELFCMEEEKSE